VELQMQEAGVFRSRRQVLRLCQKRTFDAAQVGPLSEWYIAPASVPRVIGSLRALDADRERRAAARRDMARHDGSEDQLILGTAMSRHGATDPDATGRVKPESKLPIEEDTARHDAPDPDAHAKGSATEHDMARHVQQLETRIKEKDETIKFLQDELVDRRTQI